MAGGRRGTISLMYEVIMSLVLLLLFGVIVFTYINAKASGGFFWSQVYAADLGTTADVVNAAYGDVLLRYDNLKPNLELTFWSKNGLISVYTRLEPVAPPEAPSQMFGPAKEFPQPGVYTNPRFLAFRKIGRAYSLMETELELGICSREKLTVPLADARVYLEASEEIKNTFSEILLDTQIFLSTEEGATIILRVKKVQGTNAVTFQLTNTDGGTFACLFEQKLRVLSLLEHETNTPATSGSAFTVDITLATETDDATIGRALAFALAEVYG